MGLFNNLRYGLKVSASGSSHTFLSWELFRNEFQGPKPTVMNSPFGRWETLHPLPSATRLPEFKTLNNNPWQNYFNFNLRLGRFKSSNAIASIHICFNVYRYIMSTINHWGSLNNSRSVNTLDFNLFDFYKHRCGHKYLKK